MAEAHKESERKGVTSFKTGSEGAGVSEEEQVVVTIDAPSGRIIKVEKLDKAAKRQELTEEEWAKLVGNDEVEEIETVLEEGFEAGVAAALGEEFEDDDADEDDDERDLRQLLIGELLRRPVKRRILQRLLLSRLLRRRSLKSRSRQ